MRSIEELAKAAFTDNLTAEEDDRLFQHHHKASETDARSRIKGLKQAAFFAGRAFDKGYRDAEHLGQFIAALNAIQTAAPTDSFKRKLNEMKAAKAGKGAHEAALKKLSRQGEAGPKSLLATEAQLADIERELGLTLPPSYRTFLLKYAHRHIGTYELFTAFELVAAVQEAYSRELPENFMPFLEDNSDFYCFDFSAAGAEPPVVYYPHDGSSNESWANFAAWIEECWLEE